MPITTTVTTLPRPGPSTAGSYLAAVAAERCEPADLMVVPVGASGQVAADAELEQVLGLGLGDIIAAYGLTGKTGQTASLLTKVGDAAVKVLFVGVGDRSAGALRRAGGEIGRTLKPGTSAVCAWQSDEQVRAFTEGVLLGSYRYSEKSAAVPDAADAATMRMAWQGAAHGDPIGEATEFAAAVALARDLANTPSARKSPQWLADAAVDVAARSGLTARVRDARELAESGFEGILAVGSGSERPPRLIELRYEPPGTGRHIALVGKGITFDSGGLSLKPNDRMKAMKTDMAGGAAIIAAMSALARLGVADRVTGLVAAAENLPSGSAYRPGDVITQYGGRTVEVLNTDAEGRLVLADALAYADAVLAPDQIVDLATLTGAARVALGSAYGALYSTSDELAAALIQAGQASGDRLWRMPLTADYRAALDSPVADLAHFDRADGGAGSISAALFLREFTGSRPWAHLDIAGPARCAADDGELTVGATGFGTRLLLRWLLGSSAG